MSIEKALSGKGKKKLDLDQFMKLAEKGSRGFKV